jgi:putative membrane protein
MRTRTLLLCGALAFAAPGAALAQSDMSSSMSPPSASSYVTMAGQSDQFEIQEGQLAQQKGKSAGVRKFGAEMVKDHTKSTAMVQAAAAKSGMSPPSSPPPLDAEQQQMLSQLQSTDGDAFDQTYISQQMQSHQKALALQQAYAQGGDDKNLKAAAAKITPVVQKHIAMLQGMSSGKSMSGM